MNLDFGLTSSGTQCMSYPVVRLLKQKW